ncbi:hypothetical protein Aduo_018931 [Ancylostoma duodenale]
MDTALAPAPPTVQVRRGKKHKIEFDSPPKNAEIDEAVDLVLNDAPLPSYLGIVASHLVEFKEQFAALVIKNHELIAENELARKKSYELLTENNSLRSEIDNLKLELSRIRNSSHCSDDANHTSPPHHCEESESRRSIVTAGLPECNASMPTARVIYDINSARRIFDFLSIEAHPAFVYRMGRFNPDWLRLLKVVAPSSYFVALILRPRLGLGPIRDREFSYAHLSRKAKGIGLGV